MTYTRQATRVEGTEKQEIVTTRGKYYTVMAASVIKPSPDYPTPMVSFRIGNGADSCFAQMRIEEFQHLIRILEDWEKLYLEIFPGLRKEEAVYSAAKDARDKQLAAIRQLMGDDEEKGGMSPAKIIELAQKMGQFGGTDGITNINNL